MNYLIENLINTIDRIYHQRKIFNHLKKLHISRAIDVGTHKGEFLSFLLTIKGIQEIHAFEPQKEIYDLLNLNFGKNKKIILNNEGVSDINSTREMSLNSLTSTSTFSTINKSSSWFKFKNLILNKKNSFQKKIKVKTIRLDEYFEVKNINKIDLLKVDTEGHEIKVLNGAKKIFENDKIKYLLIEIHGSNMYKDYRSSDIYSFLEEKNFKLVKRFKFPLLKFEDQLYENVNIQNM